MSDDRFPSPRVQVIVNPASGRAEPILTVLIEVFGRHGVEWGSAEDSVAPELPLTGAIGVPGPMGRSTYCR